MLKPLIKELGGNVEVADALSNENVTLRPWSINKWKKRGSVPYEWRTALRRLCDQRGRELCVAETVMLEPDITAIPKPHARTDMDNPNV